MIETDRYAVFGYPISHSKSPRIHTLFALQTGQENMIYTAKAVRPGEFDAAVKAFFARGGKGLNCTVPLKELAWKIAGQLNGRAAVSRAVNTLALRPDGSLYGDNTDGIGLVRDLTVNQEIRLHGTAILILGAGGAARGIIGPLLEQHPARLAIANRTAAKAFELVEEFGRLGPVSACGFENLKELRFDLILNATAASLKNELPPLPEDLLAPSGCCYDLAYGNAPTPFVAWGRAQKAQKSVDGLGMLVEQAAEAFCLWRGVRPVTAPIIELLNREREI